MSTIVLWRVFSNKLFTLLSFEGQPFYSIITTTTPTQWQTPKYMCIWYVCDMYVLRLWVKSEFEQMKIGFSSVGSLTIFGTHLFVLIRLLMWVKESCLRCYAIENVNSWEFVTRPFGGHISISIFMIKDFVGRQIFMLFQWILKKLIKIRGWTLIMKNKFA